MLRVKNKKVFLNSASRGSTVDLSSSPPPSTSSMQAAFLSTPQCMSDLLQEFPDVLQSDGFTAAPPSHQVCHHILTKPGPSVFAKALHLDPAKLAVAKAEFSAMEKAGIIHRSTSLWASPLHMVKKKDGG